jgi:dTDP-4-dehydrorhamnose reductase
VVAASDAVVSPTYVVDLVNATLDLLIDLEAGIWHLSNIGASSWAALAQRAAALAGLRTELIDAVPTLALGYPARRPRYSVLASERGTVMPSLEDALGRYMHDSLTEATRHDRRSPGTPAEGRRRSGRAA